MASALTRSLVALMFALCTFSEARSFRYLTYDAIVIKMKELARDHPGLVEIWNAQEHLGVPSPGTCSENGQSMPCRQYYIRITNEATLPLQDTVDTRPEVFFSGCLHGNERIGPTTVTELAVLLLENYNLPESSRNPWLKRLVDTRSIWIMPTANALGYHQNRREENNIDPNRDFAFDQLATQCMRTTAARAVNELWRRHAFQLAITYHAGMVMIGYEWGSPNHNGYRQSVSPDDTAQKLIATAMSRFGGNGATSRPYPFGTMNEQVYPVHGGMEDWAYAGSWDHTQSQGPPNGCTPTTYGGYPADKTRYDTAMLRLFNFLVRRPI